MEHNFKRGELVLVGDGRHSINNKRIFLTYIEGANSPFICVDDSNTEDFKNGLKFSTCTWKLAKPIETKLTEKEAIEKIIEHLKLDIKLK